jgi:lipopolysaccharide assembly outer membrane protein LptD (OstA)
VYFRATAAVDPYETRVRSATTDTSYQARDWRASFGTRHGESGSLEFIQGSVEAKLGPRWSARFSTNYDVEASTIIENRFEVAFREQCWAITAAYINRTDEDEFHITVNLLELGQYGFGRAFASSQ